MAYVDSVSAFSGQSKDDIHSQENRAGDGLGITLAISVVLVN